MPSSDNVARRLGILNLREELRNLEKDEMKGHHIYYLYEFTCIYRRSCRAVWYEIAGWEKKLYRCGCDMCKLYADNIATLGSICTRAVKWLVMVNENALRI